MFLSSINLRNIRKHANNRIDFTNHINYIIGGNGVGKTSVLEAIYYLTTTKSCVTSSDSETVKMGEVDFAIQGFFDGKTEDSVQVIYSKLDNKKTYILNNKHINKFSEIIGKFPVVLLSPADHAITQGFSSDRRRFIDSVMSQASKTYLSILIEYNKTLKHRSVLLNRIRENKQRENEELEAWNEKMIKTGTEIIKHRINFINEYEVYVKQSYQKILSEKENPGIYYYYLEDTGGENLENNFARLLEQRAAEELRRGANLVGPHRDDFVFEINKLNLKRYGSQGQHKTFQTILRFAEYYYLKDKKETTPIFLLDDVFGELDTERARAISQNLSELSQTIITLTDFTNISYLKKRNDDRAIMLSANSEVSYV